MTKKTAPKKTKALKPPADDSARPVPTRAVAVEITAEDLGTDEPVKTALDRATGLDWRVGCELAFAGEIDDLRQCALPAEVVDFIANRDRGDPTEPMSFNVEF